jgi:hypothetical protein
MGMFGEQSLRPRDHRESPAITVYIIDDDSAAMDKVSCWYCKRTMAEIKGRIDNVITSPISVVAFGIAVNIRCKLCHQNYRFVANAQVIQG